MDDCFCKSVFNSDFSNSLNVCLIFSKFGLFVLFTILDLYSTLIESFLSDIVLYYMVSLYII